MDRGGQYSFWGSVPTWTFFLRIGEAHNPPTLAPGWDVGFRNFKDLFIKAVIDPQRQITGDLQVLFLVFTDRDQIGVVKQDIGGHQDRIGHETGCHYFLFSCFVFKLCHPS